jgi:pilus assembly protein TadC
MGKLSLIPIVGWVLSLFFTMSLAVPFYLFYNPISKRYFYFLPEQYHNLPFWDIVMVFTVVGILKFIFVPKIVEVNQKVED